MIIACNNQDKMKAITPFKISQIVGHLLKKTSINHQKIRAISQIPDQKTN
jgi:hypothetical protein